MPEIKTYPSRIVIYHGTYGLNRIMIAKNSSNIKRVLKVKFLDRHTLPVYLEREQVKWVFSRAYDLNLSASAYVRSLIDKDKLKS